MEAEAEKLKELQSEVESQMSMGDGNKISALSFEKTNSVGSASMGSANFPTLEEKVDADNRSIYIGQVQFFLFLDFSKLLQVDYGSTAEELEQHFHGCGALNRVTIICDKYSGQPKGFAYIEFTEKESVDAAIALDGSMFRDRQIKVMPKRTNKPGVR